MDAIAVSRSPLLPVEASIPQNIRAGKPCHFLKLGYNQAHYLPPLVSCGAGGNGRNASSVLVLAAANATTRSRSRGVRYLVTTTPRLEGRSFGTNAMEAALTALAGKGRPLSEDEIQELIVAMGHQPSIERI